MRIRPTVTRTTVRTRTRPRRAAVLAAAIAGSWTVIALAVDAATYLVR